MNTKASGFLNRLASMCPEMAQSRDATIEYWTPDKPPITVAFSEVDHVLTDEMATLDDSVRQTAFMMIEEAISSEDEQILTAVATGLIEGMVGRATKCGTYSTLLAMLEPNSKLHAQAWHNG